MSLAATALLELRKLIEAVSSPNLRCVEGAQPVHLLPVNTVQLTPAKLERVESAGGSLQRWRLTVLAALRSTVGSSGATASAYTDVLDGTRALLAVLSADASLATLRAAGFENVLRGATEIWLQPPADTGKPGGCLVMVHVTWTES